MTVPFADNSEFLKAISLLIDLQFAICRDNEDQADALRDALDTPLKRLSWEANEWLRGLSGDLEMLCGQEVFEPNELSEAEYQQKLLDACRNIENDPQDMLILLRKEQKIASPDVTAYFRGRCYSLLGLHQVGTLFLRRAVELAPHRVQFKVLLLGNLWSTGDLKQAQPLIRAILDDKDADPNAVLLAIGIVFQSVRKISPVNRENLGMLRQKLEKVLRFPPLLVMSPSVASFGFILLGAIAELLNRKSQARTNYSKACGLTPSDATPFFLRGRLTLEDDQQKALADFRHAVNLGVFNPLPYLVLARVSLENGDYGNCDAMCLSAIKIGDSAVQGQAYHLLALSEVQAHGLTDLAQQYFEEAHRLSPTNVSVQENSTSFDQARKQYGRNSSGAPLYGAKDQFDLQEVNQTVHSDGLNLVLNSRSSQLWSEVNLINAPSNARLSIAA